MKGNELAFLCTAKIVPPMNMPGMTQGQDYGPQHPYLAGGDGTEWFLDPPAPAPPPQSPPPKDPGGPQSKPPLLPCNSKVCIRS